MAEWYPKLKELENSRGWGNEGDKLIMFQSTVNG